MGHIHYIDTRDMENYERQLIDAERSRNTIEKYIRDIRSFHAFLDGGAVDKQSVMLFKDDLTKEHKATSVNSTLVAVNGFLKFMGWGECCVKLLKTQRQIFREESRELTKAEYALLCAAAKASGQERLMLVMETICATGIRVSELRYITIEAVRAHQAEISCKGKRRLVFIPKALRQVLTAYARARGINSGVIFRTKTGKPLDRSNIWHDMKALCLAAGVERSKVFPHSLRHLFARTFYGMEKDLVRLADILGHSSVDTTRIYTASSGAEFAAKVERLGLVV